MNAPILEDLWKDLSALYELAADVDFEVRYAPGIDERVRGRAESLAPVAATLYARRVG